MRDREGVRDLYHHRRWGAWELDAKRLALVHAPDGYEVDLEDINSSAAMLDWIFQIERWATPQELADLLQALRDIFHPQATLCSGGADKRIDGPARFLQGRFAVNRRSLHERP